MPIFEQTYRSYEGNDRLMWRWRAIVWQELRTLIAAKPFLMLLAWASLLFLLRAAQVIAVDSFRSSNRNVAAMLNQFDALAINEAMFLNFLRTEGPVMVVILLYAGSGMICNDFRNNLMEVFFSKPLTWIDYVLGKSIALILIGLGVTLVPGLLLLLLHNLLVPGMKTLRDTAWLAGPIVAFSCLMTLPTAFAVLASSALSHGQRQAATALFVLLMGDLIIPRAFAAALFKPECLVLSVPLAINQVGETLFGQRNRMFDLPWGWGVSLAAAVAVTGAVIVCLRTRRAEAAA
ncbi:MAG TPA: ABC transporter permease subunit [Candidatus Hydrogenedentes bacterium]|nr:ABC transporter permease subunit [Candidatus Hydrogenedentota bacterium]HOS03822.1 ABC transporter permease subunit [Candidatus Hydrogenedentota bacterium]